MAYRPSEDSCSVYRIIITARVISSNVPVVITPIAESEIRQYFTGIRGEAAIRTFETVKTFVKINNSFQNERC